jgi:hypothetical protein
MNIIPDVGKNRNGYAGFSAMSATTFLIVEAHDRLGLDLTVYEASFIVGAITAAVLFLGKHRPA